MTLGSHAPVDRAGIINGILFMCGAAMCFSFMNATAKYLSTVAGFSSTEVIWARSLGHSLTVFALFAPRHGLRVLLTSRRTSLQVIRSLLLLTSTACFFISLRFIPLTLASTISFTGPFIVTALAVPMLGEKVGMQRWLAVLVGFIGAVIAIRPGTADFHWATSLTLVSASCYAVYQILTRRVVGVDSAETTVSYAALVGTVVMTLIVPLIGARPSRPAM